MPDVPTETVTKHTQTCLTIYSLPWDRLYCRHVSFTSTTTYLILQPFLHRHDLWYSEDVDMASLRRVVADPEIVVTHDACSLGRRQAFPDVMLVNSQVAERMIFDAGRMWQYGLDRRGRNNIEESAAAAGLKVRLVEMKTPTITRVDASGLLCLNFLRPGTTTNEPGTPSGKGRRVLSPPTAEAAKMADAHDLTHGGPRVMCVNNIGAWDVTYV